MRNLLTFLLAFSFVIMLGGCRQRNSDAVTVGLPEKFSSFDTLTGKAAPDAAAERIKSLIFNSLVRKDEAFDYIGELANTIETSPDGRVITFHLRDDVKFHNGKTFTSGDVKYTFDQLFQLDGQDASFKSGAFFDTVPVVGPDPTDKPVPSGLPSANIPANAGTKPAEAQKTKRVPHIESISTPDEKTVVFSIARRSLRNQLLSNLVAIPIIPEGTVGQLKENPVGSGPFRFVSFDSTQNIIELAANEQYWEGAPKLTRLRVKVLPDAASLQAELQAGSVDIAPNPSNMPPDMLRALSSNPNLKLDQFDGSNIQYLVFNIQPSPLNDVKLRQAIGYALDRQKIVDELLLGQGRLAHSILPPESWAYTPGNEYVFNPARARQLLQEAGYSGESITFKFGSGSAYVNQYSQAIQSSLIEVGLNVQIETLDRPTIVTQLGQGQFQMYTGIWVGGNQDPIFLKDLFSTAKIPIPGGSVSCCNRSRYSNSQVDKLLEDALNATDKTVAKELYARAWEQISRDLPLLPLWYPANIVVSNKRIGNVKMSGSGDWAFLKDVTVN